MDSGVTDVDELSHIREKERLRLEKLVAKSNNKVLLYYLLLLFAIKMFYDYNLF